MKVILPNFREIDLKIKSPWRTHQGDSCRFDWIRSVIWPFIFNYRLFFGIVIKTLKSFFSGIGIGAEFTRLGAGLWV